jgi:hypothetical protein
MRGDARNFRIEARLTAAKRTLPSDQALQHVELRFGARLRRSFRDVFSGNAGAALNRMSLLMVLRPPLICLGCGSMDCQGSTAGTINEIPLAIDALLRPAMRLTVFHPFGSPADVEGILDVAGNCLRQPTDDNIVKTQVTSRALGEQLLARRSRWQWGVLPSFGVLAVRTGRSPEHSIQRASSPVVLVAGPPCRSAT